MKEQKYASFTLRVIASIIDTLLSTVILIPIINFFGKFINLSNPQEALAGKLILSQEEALQLMMQSLPSFLLQSSVLTAVIIIFWIYRAATPGKMLLKMKIIDAKTGQKISKRQSIIRYLGYFVSTLPLCLGFVWIHFDKRRQGFHDKIAGTVVVIDK